MSAISLVPVSEFSIGNLPVAANPPMSYDVTLGTPTAQGIFFVSSNGVWTKH